MLTRLGRWVDVKSFHSESDMLFAFYAGNSLSEQHSDEDLRKAFGDIIGDEGTTAVFTDENDA